MSDYLCPVCENIYETQADAETCCASPEPEWDDVCDRYRYEDDGRTYADPRDFKNGYED